MAKDSKKPWKTKRPPGPKRTLTAAQKAKAQKAAKAAGRRYPNLIDNMNALKD
jgi:hypothetical protein